MENLLTMFAIVPGPHVQRPKEMEFHFPILCSTNNAQTAPKKSTPTSKNNGAFSLQCQILFCRENV